MEPLYQIITLALSITLIFLSLILSTIAVRILAFKSTKNPEYPPARGTIFHLAHHFQHIHNYFFSIAAETPTFRILLPAVQSYVYTVEPENVEHVLKRSFAKYSKGSRTREIMSDLLGDGILAADADTWLHQRKLASVEFSARVLRDFSCLTFRRNAAKLVRVVSEFSKTGRVFDLQDLFMRLTLDSISKVGMGVELNCLEGSTEKTTRFMKAFDTSNASVFWRFVDPLWKIKRFLHIGSELTLRNQVKIVDHFVYDVIRKRRKLLALERENNAREHEKEDILSRFLIESEKDGEKMNDKYLRDIALSFIFAGKDTTAGTLSWFFYMMCQHSLVQQKVVQEVRDIVGNDDNLNFIVEDFVENISEKVLNKMHYLHAAISETLRLYPAVPVDGRCAEVDDTLPNGFKIKKGDEVFYLSHTMGRMACIWGDDASDFRPERWLKDGVFQPESPFKFAAFHAGPRICLGKDFAYRQMKIVSIALLRFFHFKLVRPDKTLTYKSMLTLHIDKGLFIYAHPRTS